MDNRGTFRSYLNFTNTRNYPQKSQSVNCPDVKTQQKKPCKHQRQLILQFIVQISTSVHTLFQLSNSLSYSVFADHNFPSDLVPCFIIGQTSSCCHYGSTPTTRKEVVNSNVEKKNIFARQCIRLLDLSIKVHYFEKIRNQKMILSVFQSCAFLPSKYKRKGN